MRKMRKYANGLRVSSATFDVKLLRTNTEEVA